MSMSERLHPKHVLSFLINKRETMNNNKTITFRELSGVNIFKIITKFARK